MRRLLVLALLLAATSVLPASALGKGASEATISGPGLAAPITLSIDDDGSGAELLMALAEASGFFPAVFAKSPDPMLDERPAGDLGPSYAVEYVLPGPDGERDALLQRVYPYADPSPVTHVTSLQPYWTGQLTRGGWYMAGPELRDLLVVAGLPETPPVESAPPADPPWTVLGPVGGLVAVAALAALALALAARRRPQTA
jgi:hypothetical protein